MIEPGGCLLQLLPPQWIRPLDDQAGQMMDAYAGWFDNTGEEWLESGPRLLRAQVERPGALAMTAG